MCYSLFMHTYLFSVSDLDETTDHLIQHALKSSTRATYSSAQRKFIQFCQEFKLVALPVVENTLIYYVSYLHERGLKGTSIQVYLSAIKSLHLHCGLPYPMFTPRLNLALRGAKVLSSPPLRKLPITFSLLCKLINNMSYHPDELLLQVAMAVAFFGCLRCGELCVPDHVSFDPLQHLCFKDLKFFHNEHMFSLFLRKSKTDKFSNGVEVYVGCSSHVICAYCLMCKFVKTRIDDSPDSPLFSNVRINVLRRSFFVNATRLALSALHLDPSMYSGHSFRAGSATSGADSGFSQWELRMLGRWRSECFHIYLRNPKIVASFAQRLASS